MADQAATIEHILSIEDDKRAKFKSIEVFKEVEPVTDLGNLYLSDQQPIEVKELRANNAAFLNALARDNAQLLFNKIWELPIERVDNIIVGKLPPPTIILPREKKVPKAKPLTKWETFAKRQGIRDVKKRGRMLWDEETKTWKPRFGYKRGKDDTKDWCIEVPVNADPNENQFEKRNADKKERVAKNEFQRLRNIEKTTNTNKGKPDIKEVKEKIGKEIDLAKVSTASLGKFQERLPKEKINKKTGLKRKFESVTGSSNTEKERSLEVWKKISNKKAAPLDVTKGVNKHIANEQREAASQKAGGKSGKVKNRRFKKGAKSATDKKKFAKGKTLGKGKQKK